MRQDVNLSVIPRYEFAVAPNFLGGLHSISIDWHSFSC
jgi:hypothetical protein